jgi:hypothetical protein
VLGSLPAGARSISAAGLPAPECLISSSSVGRLSRGWR